MITALAYLDELLTAALDYADRGWPVFPLVPYTKQPACPAHNAASCNRSDPHCRGGHTTWEQRATRDPGRIRRAWSTRPYGIGIACGPAGLLVVDTDHRKPGRPVPAPWDKTSVRTGDTVLVRLAAGRPLPPTWTVATPSGGFHRYYQAPAGVQLSNSAGKLGWLIDTRGHGGYVVAPPTRLTQHRYTLLDGYPDPAPLPDWITAQLSGNTPATARGQAPDAGSDDARRPAAYRVRRPARYVIAAISGECGHVRAAPRGQRNHTLFCAAVALGQLVGADLVDEHTVKDLLLAACTGHLGVDGFTIAEATTTITSDLARGKNQPRNHRSGRNVE
ncbi:bifunctional DNA primase/polymerase [Microlunatus ginsengisoli]|uniref:Bifunctional DNA primase/polymerase n=1 Tax=Microlunatus ginsengisoli TaxID=363863 RepID=A0ABP7AMJ5_9ACTN